MERIWNIYLSGEIHSEWRQEIHKGVEEKSIPVRLLSPNVNHEESDSCGDTILGFEENVFWKDHKAAKINTIRNRSTLKSCEIIVVRFGEKYRQRNAAFDAGQAVAWGKTLISLHDSSLNHALKEIDAQALAVANSPGQVVDILKYVTQDPF